MPSSVGYVGESYDVKIDKDTLEIRTYAFSTEQLAGACIFCHRYKECDRVHSWDKPCTVWCG